MICPRCFGLGSTPGDPTPCLECNGVGHTHCCDGLCEQAEPAETQPEKDERV